MPNTEHTRSKAQLAHGAGERNVAELNKNIEAMNLSGGKPSQPSRTPCSWAIRSDNPYLKVSNSTELEIISPFPEGLSKDQDPDPPVLIRADHCIPSNQDAYFWELEIVKHPEDQRCVAIGICTENSKFHILPGERGSAAYGYHSDDGNIYDMTGEGKQGLPFGVDDNVGCFLDTTDGKRRIRFTYNGKKIGQSVTLGDNMRGQLYPCVGLYAGPDAVGTVVRANFDAEWDPDCKTLTEADIMESD